MKNKYLIHSSFFCLILCVLGCSPGEQKVNSDKSPEKPIENVDPNEVNEKSKSIWEFVNDVDEFGDKIKEQRAIIGTSNGRMSNSTSTNEDVTVVIRVGKDKSTYIKFFEHGATLANLPDKQLFNIKIKKEDGNTEFIEQFSIDNMLADTKGVLLGKLLAQKSPLKINVDLKRASQYESSIFNFEIDPTGLEALLHDL